MTGTDVPGEGAGDACGAARTGRTMTVVSGLIAAALLALAPAAGAHDVLRDVEPFVGTAPGSPDFGTGGRTGATFPGASRPFGMAQFSPDTTPSRENFAGGYTWSDSRLRVRAHALLGRGLPDLPGRAGPAHDHADHDRAQAAGLGRPPGPLRAAVRPSPRAGVAGAYGVVLDPDTRRAIASELTATMRTADERFTFPRDRRASVLLDAGGSALASFLARLRIDPRRREVSGATTRYLDVRRRFLREHPRHVLDVGPLPAD